MNIKKNLSRWSEKGVVHTVYHLYVVLEYSKVIHNGWNLFIDLVMGNDYKRSQGNFLGCYKCSVSCLCVYILIKLI